VGTPLGLVAVYAGVAALAWAVVRGCRARAGRAAVAGVLALAVIAGPVVAIGGAPGPPDRFTATFLDVGQGDATLLQTPDGRTVLVDGGPPGAGLAAKLRDRGVRSLDVVVLTHAQEDHQGGLAEVLEAFDVGVLLDGGVPGDASEHREIVSLARRRGTAVRAARAGQRLRVGLGLLLRVHAAATRDSAPDTDPNLRAVVMTASYGSFDVFLPADAESEVTAPLALPDADVMKVAHHGSEDPGLTDLLARVRPETAVIEVGRGNRFGHPHPATLRTLGGAGVAVRRTDTDGDVVITAPRDG
jgi:competence protein ComEC